jgi:hypothetical protein
MMILVRFVLSVVITSGAILIWAFYLQPFIEESEDESVEIEKQGPLAKLKTTASKFVYHFQAIAIAHSDT